jgi:hypothetical protein
VSIAPSLNVLAFISLQSSIPNVLMGILLTNRIALILVQPSIPFGLPIGCFLRRRLRILIEPLVAFLLVRSHPVVMASRCASSNRSGLAATAAAMLGAGCALLRDPVKDVPNVSCFVLNRDRHGCSPKE